MTKRRKRKKQISKKKPWKLLLVLGGVLLLGVAFYVSSKPAAKIEPGEGILATPVTVHDFGVVPVSGGVVSVDMPLVNIGEEDLVISFLNTSCGCTSAQVIIDGKTGPVFGMSSHGKSPRNWKSVIEPGKQASLTIYYDPAVHPKFRGAATRIITITSNERLKPEKQVRIKVNQVD